MDKHIRDIMNKTEDEAPVLLDKVIKDIFMSCDTDNEGIVPVSKLIDFIMPFLQGNMHALEELQKSLDPNNIDRSIDIDTFYKDMNEWTLKISSADHTDEDDIHNITPIRDFERILPKDCSFLQSTPRSSFGHHLLKGYVESGISNLSISSSINEHPDRTVLEEQIQELQHQKRQVCDELARVKIELTSITEQNETLQIDLDKVIKKLASEQKINSQLQTERKKEDDCEEELCCARKQVMKLERSLANLEKFNIQLQQELDAIVTEKQGLEHTIQRMGRKSEETRSSMVMLQTEIDFRKLEVDSEQKTNEALAQQNQELCDIIEKCIINIDRLKLEKAMLTKFYRERMNKNESLLTLDLSRSLRSNSFSEYAGISRKLHERRRVSDVTARYTPPNRTRQYNSPKLLRMLREPVTPSLDKAAKLAESKEENSNHRGELNLASVLLNRNNMPYSNKQDLKTISPIELSKVPNVSSKLRYSRSSKDCVPVEMLENIFDKAMDLVSGDNQPFGTLNSPNMESPPSLYVIERSPITSSPIPYSPKMNDSGEEFFFNYNNYDMMSNTERPNENLLDEMAKASVCNMDEESEYEESISEEVRNKRNRNAKTYISEVHLKLDEYMDLEQKCEILEQKIEELESENGVKDIKIDELTNEIEKLQQKNKTEELLLKIEELESEKKSLKIEKNNLIKEIKILQEEKAILELSKEELLLKIVESDRVIRGKDKEKHLPVVEKLQSKIISDKSHKIENIGLEFAKKDFECLKLDYEKNKSAMETYQKLNENLTTKNSLLQKNLREKEAILEDKLSESRDNDTLKNEIYELKPQLDDYKKNCANLENEVKKRRLDYGILQEQLSEKEKNLEDLSKALKEMELKNENLESILVNKDEISNEYKVICEEFKKKYEQEVKKQDYLCKKFVNLQNELLQEKSNSDKFKEKCDNLLKDVLNFKENMTQLEHEIDTTKKLNEDLTKENITLSKFNEIKLNELQSLAEAKHFLAKRNEELLQENDEIFIKYDQLSKEYDYNQTILEESKQQLSELEYFKIQFDRLNSEDKDITLRCKSYDNSEDTAESDLDGCRKSMSQRNQEKRGNKKANFDRLTVRNNKLEERNTILCDRVSELQAKLEKEVEAKNSVMNHTNVIKDIMYERRNRLQRVTDTTIESWQETLEKFSNVKLFADEIEPDSAIVAITGPLDEEMSQLKHQIHQTTVLLSYLTNFMNRQTLKKNEYVQTEHDASVIFQRTGEVSTTTMEQSFATLVLTYTVDKDLLEHRLHTKKVELGELERSLGEAVSALTIYLEENAIGLNVVNFMNNILQLCTNVSISAIQYGSIRQQVELTATAEMMVNYVGNLRQEIEILSQQLPEIGPTTDFQERIEFQSDEKLDLEMYNVRPRRFISCSKRTCLIFTISVFVLVASLVLNTDFVFRVHRCPLPT